jgi:FkbM family methyltransferase
MDMLESLVKATISKIPFQLRYQMFYQAARSLGVTAYQAVGEQGQFFGVLADQSIVKPYLRDHQWSTHIVDLVRQFFAGRPSGTFYDVGANIGLTLIPIAKNKAIRCIGFEPDPTNFRLLLANVASNASLTDLKNVAVADKAGQMRFARNGSGNGNPQPEDDLAIACIALDDMPVPPAPFAIKIDTQGAEPLIFQGGKAHLAAAGLIVCEFWPWAIKRLGHTPDPIIDFVRDFTGKAMVMRRGKLGSIVDVRELVFRLEELVARGGEQHRVDFVLMRE